MFNECHDFIFQVLANCNELNNDGLVEFSLVEV